MDPLERLSAALADRYTLERELGQGGMATVYLAHDLKHDRKVAIKVLKPELAAVLGADRFVQEIKTTAALSHPHILPLFDSGVLPDEHGQPTGCPYYVMPYIQGETIRDTLNRETQLGIDEAVKITAEVADALDYAHRHGVIHRDIKPENILLHDGRPMVMDFGIALAVSAAAGGRMTETGLSLGTPHYMSPEQATAEKEITARSDIYSLGSVLYEMLTGEPPHMGTSAQAIIMKIVTEEAQPVTRLRKSVPPHVAAAVAQALEKLPADRFASAADLASALADPTFGRDRRTSSRTVLPTFRARVVAGSVVGTALLAGVALGARLGRTPLAPRETIRFQLSIPPVPNAGLAPRMALSPDGRRLAYVAPRDGEPRTLHVQDLARLEPTVIGAPAWSTAFSPDGASIAWVTGTGEIRVAPSVGGGGGSRTVVTGASWSHGIEWSQDGFMYYAPGEGTEGIWRVPVNGGSPAIVVAPDTIRAEQQYNRPAWIDVLPGERGAIVTFPRGPGFPSDIAAVDLSTGRVTYLLKGMSGRYIEGLLVFVAPDGTLTVAPFDEKALTVTGPARPTGIRVHQEGQSPAMFALSDQGRLLYAPPLGGISRLTWVDRTGREETVAPDLWRNINSVSLSPDGRRIAMGLREEGQDGIWIHHLEEGTLSRLTFDGTSVWRPVWSGDGLRVGFVSDRLSTDLTRSLWIVPADRSREPELLASDDRHAQELTWSADGRAVAYRTGFTDGATRRDIFVLRSPQDTVPRPFLATPADEQHPKLSPDGRWLAYVSDESGKREVYVRPFPEGPGLWQVSVGGGDEPLWRRDGRELFYRDAMRNLVAVPVTAGGGFATGAPRTLFSTLPYYSEGNTTSYDVSLDGTRFLMIKQPIDQTLVVVVNWTEELRER